MENLSLQPKENIQVATIENGITTYNPAVYNLQKEVLPLSQQEMKELSRPFEDDQVEIRPDGFLYIPHAVIRMRYIDTLGPSGFALILYRSWEKAKTDIKFNVFYDGGLYLRGSFVSRAVGEGKYSTDNSNTSEASGLESAKSDCLVRCSKDLGIGLQVYDPSFIRRWQKDKAVQVWVKEYNYAKKADVSVQRWRRNDVSPFPNEISAPTRTPTAGKPADKSTEQEDTPWLNHGPDYDAALKQLQDCKITLAQLKVKWKISSKTMDALRSVLTEDWRKFTGEKNTLTELTKLYNGDIEWIKQHDFIQAVFTDRRKELQKKAV